MRNLGEFLKFRLSVKVDVVEVVVGVVEPSGSVDFTSCVRRLLIYECCECVCVCVRRILDGRVCVCLSVRVFECSCVCIWVRRILERVFACT